MVSIYQRDGVWWLTCYERGKRIRYSLKTADAAAAERIRLRKERDLALIEHGIVPPTAHALTGPELVALYTRRREARGGSGRPMRNDIGRIERVLAEIGIPPCAMQPADIERWVTGRRRKRAAPASIRRDIAPLLTALRQAFREGLLIQDPGAQVSLPTVPQKRIVFLRPPEVAQLLMAARAWRDGQALPGVAIAAYCGLRQGEILHLDWTDVELDDRRLHVAAKPGWSPKTGEARVVPIPDPLAAILSPIAGAGPVLADEDGGRRGRTWAKLVMEALRKSSGVVAAGWHVLRHTYASELVGQGVSIFQVSKLLGHRTVRMTERSYAALAPSELGEQVKRLRY